MIGPTAQKYLLSSQVERDASMPPLRAALKQTQRRMAVLDGFAWAVPPDTETYEQHLPACFACPPYWAMYTQAMLAHKEALQALHRQRTAVEAKIKAHTRVYLCTIATTDRVLRATEESAVELASVVTEAGEERTELREEVRPILRLRRFEDALFDVIDASFCSAPRPPPTSLALECLCCSRTSALISLDLALPSTSISMGAIRVMSSTPRSSPPVECKDMDVGLSSRDGRDGEAVAHTRLAAKTAAKSRGRSEHTCMHVHSRIAQLRILS